MQLLQTSQCCQQLLMLRDVHCQPFIILPEADVRTLIMSSIVLLTYSLDPVPTVLLHDFVDAHALLPYVTCMVNSSPSHSRLPDSQKHAIVTPLLKRHGIDTSDLLNYRPLSSVTFMLKIVERTPSVLRDR